MGRGARALRALALTGAARLGDEIHEAEEQLPRDEVRRRHDGAGGAPPRARSRWGSVCGPSRPPHAQERRPMVSRGEVYGGRGPIWCGRPWPAHCLIGREVAFTWARRARMRTIFHLFGFVVGPKWVPDTPNVRVGHVSNWPRRPERGSFGCSTGLGGVRLSSRRVVVSGPTFGEEAGREPVSIRPRPDGLVKTDHLARVRAGNSDGRISTCSAWGGCLRVVDWVVVWWGLSVGSSVVVVGWLVGRFVVRLLGRSAGRQDMGDGASILHIHLVSQGFALLVCHMPVSTLAVIGSLSLRDRCGCIAHPFFPGRPMCVCVCVSARDIPGLPTSPQTRCQGQRSMSGGLSPSTTPGLSQCVARELRKSGFVPTSQHCEASWPPFV